MGLSMGGEPAHPYSPTTLELPGFVPAFLSQAFILGVFSLASLVVVAFGWILSGRFKHVTKVERFLVCWWLFTGLIHIILEGYFAFTPDFYKLPYSNFFAEVWKEYGKGDSRYPARDTTIVLIEGLTAVIEGPASLVAAYAILTRKPYSHPLQMATSLGQLYGDALYFSTAYFLEDEVTAPGIIYFWGYLIFMNTIWIVVPAFCFFRSWGFITKAFESKNSEPPLKKIE